MQYVMVFTRQTIQNFRATIVTFADTLASKVVSHFLLVNVCCEVLVSDVTIVFFYGEKRTRVRKVKRGLDSTVFLVSCLFTVGSGHPICLKVECL